MQFCLVTYSFSLNKETAEILQNISFSIRFFKLRNFFKQCVNTRHPHNHGSDDDDHHLGEHDKNEFFSGINYGGKIPRKCFHHGLLLDTLHLSNLE